MYKNTTNEFSFVLKPAKHGVGVFATHGIQKGTPLRLFGDSGKEGDSMRRKNDIPTIFQSYCVGKGEEMICPQDFGAMAIGWYMNHSKNANATHKDYYWEAARNIEEGEEILIDYNLFGEPEESKENYYLN